jgi:zinc/manganese transport system substrate-binding protein
MIDRRLFLGLAVGASATALHAQDGRLAVVTSFSILGDMVQTIGGDRIALTTLVQPGTDAHVYAPTPSDARQVAAARLVIANGLNFDGWIRRLGRASASKATFVDAATGIAGQKQNDAHGHGGVDPHAWQSVANAKIYAGNIRDALVAADPAGKRVYEANAARYLAELDALDAEIRASVARIPADRRKIITSHDSFGYFAEAYGIAFIAPRGLSTESEASAKDVARLIQQIRREKITAVFVESVSDPRLIQQIARESGAKVGGSLFSDALSKPDGAAPTYIHMMRHNIRTISEALLPNS